MAIYDGNHSPPLSGGGGSGGGGVSGGIVCIKANTYQNTGLTSGSTGNHVKLFGYSMDVISSDDMVTTAYKYSTRVFSPKVSGTYRITVSMGRKLSVGSGDAVLYFFKNWYWNNGASQRWSFTTQASKSSTSVTSTTSIEEELIAGAEYYLTYRPSWTADGGGSSTGQLQVLNPRVFLELIKEA